MASEHPTLASFGRCSKPDQANDFCEKLVSAFGT